MGRSWHHGPRLGLTAALVLAAVGAWAAPPRWPRRAPAWTRHEAGPCPRPFSPRLRCAVGKAEGVASELGRSAAATRARTALAAALRRERGEAPPAASPVPGDAAVSGTLAGSVILAVHRTPDGTWFALAGIEAPAAAAARPR